MDMTRTYDPKLLASVYISSNGGSIDRYGLIIGKIKSMKDFKMDETMPYKEDEACVLHCDATCHPEIH